MTENQIKQAIRTGMPFFAVTAHGDILARYLPWAPVFRWQKNQMLPTPLQGDDLCWWLQAANEDDEAESKPAADDKAEGKTDRAA